MHLQSTVITPSYPAFFDELEKIAQHQQRQNLNKEKLKRHLKAMGAVLAGGAIGGAAGTALKRYVSKNKGRIQDFVRKYPNVLKYAPVAVGGLGMLAAGALAARTKAHLKYVEKGNEDRRPKQHRP